MKAMEEKAFIQVVKKYFKEHGRHNLPWRLIDDPYKIAVSELMLQQTQVSRVIEKYKEFLKVFPDVRALAKAPLADVLRAWSGLGYNRRAKFVHQMAQAVINNHKGKFPDTIEALQSLPGIGPYTAGAIYAFAYNKPWPVIETNIRSVYLHHFFKDKAGVCDKELLPIIERTLQKKNPREWYWALMDYGSHLKASGIKNNAKSKHYTKQSRFEGSNRQIRGAIMREVLKGPMTLVQITKAIDKEKEKVQTVLEDLVKEGMIGKEKNKYSIK